MKLSKGQIIVSMRVVIVLALFAGVLGFYHFLSLYKSSQRTVSKIDEDILQLSTLISSKLDTSINGLYSIRAFINVTPNFSRSQLQQYVGDLDVPRNFEGLTAFNVSLRVSEADKNQFVARMRADQNFSANGLPNFQIYPESANPVHLVLAYREPLDSHEDSLGFDLMTSPERRAAYELARDSNKPVATQEITSVVTNAKAILIMLPLYRSGASINTVAERQQAVIGVVTASFQIHDLFATILPAYTANGVGKMEIYDGTTTDQSHLILDSQPGVSTKPSWKSKTTVIDVASRPWTIRVSE